MASLYCTRCGTHYTTDQLTRMAYEDEVMYDLLDAGEGCPVCFTDDDLEHELADWPVEDLFSEDEWTDVDDIDYSNLTGTKF